MMTTRWEVSSIFLMEYVYSLCDSDAPDAATLARENAELKLLLANARAGAPAAAGNAVEGPAPGSIPRPRGAAGTNFNIQDAMGLGNTAKDRDQYKTLLVRYPDQQPYLYSP